MRLVAAVLVAVALTACSSGDGGGGEQPQPTTPAATEPAKASQPAQPKTGYGGSDYAHRTVEETELTVDSGGVSLFEPADPAPREAPVLLQFQVGSPTGYRGWIDHAVRRGSIVVYVDAALSGSTDAERIGGPVANVRAAVAELGRPGHVRPRWDRTVVFGHSIGGVVASRVAAVAATAGLRPPRAILAVQPPVADPSDSRPLRAVPADTRLVVLASDKDDRVGTEGAADLWRALGHVRDKRYVLVRSDDHGEPALEARHLFPLSGPGDEPDALDHHRLWPVLDALQDCVATGRGCAIPPVEGRWSDGRAIIGQEVRNRP